ncbi:hypothetical protein [Candidatus Leptofilum sp.]|uniref:hypothetical protein n=1 Tax=Candidatus Leptofilum sp. TaxID=3241576 RepID=UPI003B5905B2
MPDWIFRRSSPYKRPFAIREQAAVFLLQHCNPLSVYPYSAMSKRPLPTKPVLKPDKAKAGMLPLLSHS